MANVQTTTAADYCTASAKQIGYLVRLVNEREVPNELAQEIMADINAGQLTGGREGSASAFIDRLLACPERAEVAA